MITCNTCGTRISEMATLCPKCGQDPRGPTNRQWLKQQQAAQSQKMIQIVPATRPTKYCQSCGQVVDAQCVICPHCGVQIAPMQNMTTRSTASGTDSEKSRLIALLLCLLLGNLGIHRFYVGKTGTGVLWLFTLGLIGIGSLVDLIMIIAGTFTDKDGYYLTSWDT